MAKLFHSIWFKCISCLFVILLFSGASIAILSDLLYVSPEERISRSITKIYGEEKEYSIILDEEVECADFGYIDKIFIVGDKNDTEFDYLFHATGENGFKDGSITYWIRVASNNGVLSIGKMVIESNKSQSFISSINDSWHSNLYVDLQDAKYLTPWNKVANKNPDEYELIPTTGATNSKNASCNAVNCVIYFISQGGLA